MEGKTVTSGQWLVGKGRKQWSVALEKEDWKEGKRENVKTREGR